MVFPSLPIYLDPPNWPQQQQPNNQQVGIFPQQNSPRPPPPQPPPSNDIVGGGGGTGGGYQGSIRPGSMADRARLAKIHQPDATLKCPRCESTNTKFCYYNNYNLSQPRHFCKTCRRYWTRGGALRNVPVGGGCRRNKRSKGNSSKSPMKSDHRQGANNGSSSTSANSSSNGISTNAMVGHLQTQTPTTQFPFLASLQHYNSDYVSGNIGSHFGTRNGNGTGSGSDIGEFQIGVGSSSGNNGGSLLSPNGLGEQWRLPNLQQIHHQHQSQQQPQQHHQFPFLTNVEPQIGLFQFGGENNADHGGRFNSSKAIDSSSVSGMVMPQHDNTVKVEGNEGLNLPKNLLSISGNDPFWNNGSGNAWSEEAPSFAPSPNQYL